MTDPKPPLHIVELVAENVKRIRAVRIRPDGASLVIVGGKNEQGKSSTLDTIAMVLGGAGAVPDDPIRHGAKKARGAGALVVTNAKGQKISSPQALLDSICSKVSFDPLLFVREKSDKQEQILKSLVPELAKALVEIEDNAKALFEERTETRRAQKALESRLAALPPDHEGELPELELEAGALVEEAELRREYLAENAAWRAGLTSACERGVLIDKTAAQLEGKIRELEKELAAKRASLEELAQARTELARVVADGRELVAALVDPDVHAVKTELAELEQTNRKVRARAERKKLEAELERVEGEVAEQTRALDHLDEKRSEAIAAATFPIEGLGFGPSGVTFQGALLANASQSQKIRVSVAIGAALNPRVRVALVRSGNDLDRASLELLAELAEKAGLQVWLERVSEDGAGCSVWIEDGLVKEAPRDG